jgi:hypothetical protein
VSLPDRILSPMVTLRADPWTPDFGMGFEAAVDETPSLVSPFVESEDWSAPRSPTPSAPGPVCFVDGVRRVELRLIADDGGRRAPGLFGSFAVGAVRCDGRASFGAHKVGRALVLGGGIGSDRVLVPAGAAELDFEPVTRPGSEPEQPLWGLQQRMRDAEGNLAARLAAEQGDLVIVDGPLTFFDPTSAPVIGMAKQFARNYLAPEHDALLAHLEPGQRTPLFGLGDDEQPVRRFAWYTRLTPLRVPWHDHAAIVRCEVQAGVGLGGAAELADRVSAMLPAFAGRRGDPRAPQNLAPVGGLEAWLRHRMGHPGKIRRALTAWLSAAARRQSTRGGVAS